MMNPRHLVFCILSLSLPGFAVDFPKLPNTETDLAHPLMSAAEAVKGMKLPEGFAVTLFAAEPEVMNPVAMNWDARGRLWIAENFTYAERTQRFDLSLRDRVLIFEDRDGDGKADARTVFTDDVQMLTGLAIGRGGVWLMCPPQLLFIPDANGDDRPDAAPQVVLDGFTVARENYHNFANGLKWGPDGWLYGRVGHSCPGRVGALGTPDERFAPKYRAAGLDETEAAYASLLERMDKSVGDLLDLLDELGIAENTLVVFTSDNGAVSHQYRTMDPPHTHNTPLSSGKGAHLEGGIRVPLLVRWPGVAKAAAMNETPVIIYDWFPTLLKVAGALAPDHLDGLDLGPLFAGAKAPTTFSRPLVWHFPNFWGPLSAPGPVEGPGMGPSSTIRRGDWKLIYRHGDQSFELFDLAHDLGETHNLAEQQPERVRELAAELSEILRECQAPMPIVKATGKTVPLPSAAIEVH